MNSLNMGTDGLLKSGINKTLNIAVRGLLYLLEVVTGPTVAEIRQGARDTVYDILSPNVQGIYVGDLVTAQSVNEVYDYLSVNVDGVYVDDKIVKKSVQEIYDLLSTKITGDYL